MPKYVVETDKGTFEVEADREPTAADIQKHLAESPAPATNAPPATAPAAEEGRVTPQDAALFENLGAEDRLKLFMAMSVPYFKRELGADSKGGTAMVARGVGPALGQKLGAMTKIPLADRIGGAIGGMAGEFAGEQIAGEPTSPSRILAAAVPGFVKGKSLAGAPLTTLATEGAKNAATNVVAKNVETLAGEHSRKASLTENIDAAVGGAVGTGIASVLDTGGAGSAAAAQAARNSPAKALQDQFRKKGYVFIPSKEGSAVGGDLADYLGGNSPNSSALANVASLRNQETTNNLARSYIGAPKDMPFDEIHIAKLIHQAEEPYRAVAAVSPQAEASLEMFKQANGDAKKAWKAYDRNPTPELGKIAKDYGDMADLALDDIKSEAANAGKSSLVPKLEAARVQLAKIHLVDRATNFGDYNVSAKAFYHAKDFGAPVDGDGDLIARMYAANPGITRDASSITTVGSGKIPLVSSGVRSFVLSPAGQSILAGIAPKTKASEDFIAKAVRMGILSEARQDEEPARP